MSFIHLKILAEVLYFDCPGTVDIQLANLIFFTSFIMSPYRIIFGLHKIFMSLICIYTFITTLTIAFYTDVQTFLIV